MKLEQTYLFKEGEPEYFVSTVNRMSSTQPQCQYAETMAFKINSEYKQGNIVDQSESNSGSLDGHDRVINRLRKKIEESDES